MRVIKFLALLEFAVAAALILLAIGMTNWTPAAMGAIVAYGATLIWQDANRSELIIAATPQLILLVVGTPLAVGGLLAIRLQIDDGFLLAINSFALVVVAATAIWYAIRLSKIMSATPPVGR